ncbi:unnamed protein product [Closterium sp. NIES-53]
MLVLVLVTSVHHPPPPPRPHPPPHEPPTPPLPLPQPSPTGPPHRPNRQGPWGLRSSGAETSGEVRAGGRVQAVWREQVNGAASLATPATSATPFTAVAKSTGGRVGCGQDARTGCGRGAWLVMVQATAAGDDAGSSGRRWRWRRRWRSLLAVRCHALPPLSPLCHDGGTRRAEQRAMRWAERGAQALQSRTVAESIAQLL